jgi:serine/threonine protein kinase
MALNREVLKSNNTFVKYSNQYEEVLKRALKAKSPSTTSEIPIKPFFIRVKSIGMGAYSTVYLVSDEKTKTIYALKVVSKSVIKNNR